MNLDGVERFSYFREKSSRNQKNGGFKKKILLFIIIFLLIGLLFLFYFVFNGDKLFNQDKSIDFKIDLPEDIAVGQEFAFKVLANNQEKNAAIDAELFINFPEKYKYLSSQPECSEISSRGCLIKISRLSANGTKEIEIKGQIFGLAEEKISFKAEINFQLENFSSWFQKNTTEEVGLKTYPFQIDVSSPQTLSLSEEGDFKIKIKNPNEQTINSRITLLVPDGFTVNSFEPTEKEKKDSQVIWEMSFDKNEGKEINFKGAFVSGEGEKKFNLQIGVLNQDNEFFLQTEQEIVIKINQPGLVLGLKVDDNFLEDLNKNFGDGININLSYKNIGQENISNPKFKLTVNPSYAIKIPDNTTWYWTQGDKTLEKNNWQTEESDNGKNIIFSSSEISEINPGEEGEISFDLKIKDYQEVANSKPQNLKINLVGQIEATIFRQQALVLNLKSNEMNIKVNSKVKLEAEARYYSDEGLKIGSGPLPPQANATTVYVLFLRPINTSNELKNITISADLPEKTSWLGEQKSSDGSITFDNSSKKINWQINSLPVYVGGSYSYVEASFKVALTPGDTDRGQVLNLLENIKLEADDSFTGGKINATADNLDTNLIFDDLGKNKGAVE